MWYILTIQYYSALKKEFWHMQQHRWPWKTCCEISQSKKTNIVWVYSYEVPRIVKFRGRNNVVCQGLGRGGNGELMFKWVSSGEDAKVPEIDGGIVEQSCECT